jgi:hypothetical protein
MYLLNIVAVRINTSALYKFKNIILTRLLIYIGANNLTPAIVCELPRVTVRQPAFVLLIECYIEAFYLALDLIFALSIFS